jgi:hypothetical protein
MGNSQPTASTVDTEQSPQNVQDLLVKGHRTLTWAQKHVLFQKIDSGEDFMTLMKQAHDTAREENTTPTTRVHGCAELDTFMQTSSDKWTAYSNDVCISLWLASGDLKYLQHLKNNIEHECVDLLVRMSGVWALNSLVSQYNIKLGI